MAHRIPRTALVGVALLAGLTGSAMAQSSIPPAPSLPDATGEVNACMAVTSGPFVQCLAIVRTGRDGDPLVTVGPAGYGPADLQSAYGLPSSTEGAGHTIAIVDAFDDPNAEADLGTYREQFGLAPCTTANGCFRKVDQRGGPALPGPDTGWALEISLDLDMASAVCPKCSLLLVEADDSNLDNVAAAVDEAAALGATEISNSYGAPEFNGETTLEPHYHHPGIAVVAASGDSGYGVMFPAASRYVTAAGGTTLVRADNARGWAEHAWDGAGSGCSAYVDKPTWQQDRLCNMRTVADVAVVANPVTGVAVHDTFGIPADGWVVVGGTSAASPIIAGSYALAGPHPSINGASGAYPPQVHRAGFSDVIKGANGDCGSYLCAAGRGYDGPTGQGSPHGTGGLR